MQGISISLQCYRRPCRRRVALDRGISLSCLCRSLHCRAVVVLLHLYRCAAARVRRAAGTPWYGSDKLRSVCIRLGTRMDRILSAQSMILWGWCRFQGGSDIKSAPYVAELYPYTLQPHRETSPRAAHGAMLAIRILQLNGGSMRQNTKKWPRRGQCIPA